MAMIDQEEVCTVHTGDLVVYTNQQSLARRNSIGLVIGRELDGKMLVFWVNKVGRCSNGSHHHTSLHVFATSSGSLPGFEAQ